MPRGRAGPEPSAPPIHMMPSQMASDEHEARERSPPPRYEEAIAEDQYFPWTSANTTNQAHFRATSPATQREGRQLRTQSHTNSSPASPLGRNNRRAATSPPPSRITQSQQQRRRLRSGTSRTGGRLGPTSPDGNLSADTRSEDEENEDGARSGRRTVSERSTTRKRSPKSKIKRGLESIAFFIIQILD